VPVVIHEFETVADAPPAPPGATEPTPPGPPPALSPHDVEQILRRHLTRLARVWAS
jgi:hypothetical protein